MQIERLRLKNFRCYDELDIDFEPRLTVIVGENGKGKTAIFDALAIALEPYLRSFDASGRQITHQDVRRVPVYKKDMRHIDGMECHYPVEIKLEGEVYGKKLTCTRRLLEGNVPEDDAAELCERGCALAHDARENGNRLLQCWPITVLSVFG